MTGSLYVFILIKDKSCIEKHLVKKLQDAFLLGALMEECMKNQKAKNIPSKLKIQQIFTSYTEYLQEILVNIHDVLKKNISLSSQPTYKTRIKSFSSYYKKILRQKPEEALNSEKLITLTDIIGIRMICTFLEDIAVAQSQISEIFDVKEVEIKGASQSFKEFGYESIHVLVAIPKECLPRSLPENMIIPDDLVCEIQIRTILQDAWAEVEHELIYKTEFSPFDMPLRRKLASINASLSLADVIFQEIRDYQKKLQSELNERRQSFYHLADGLTNTEKMDFVPSKIERVNPYVQGTIDDLILQAIHAHNNGDFKCAIAIYTRIIDSSPKPNDIVLSVIYKHRGMAYFAGNDYENALKDFKDSFHFDGNNFRSVYYEGIVHSIQSNYEKAIECFTKSLDINEFQSHTFYRRAVAYYETNQYENAMNDVLSAQRLGLIDEGLTSLHDRLVEKFDMKL